MKQLVLIGGTALSATIYSFLTQAQEVYPEEFDFKILGFFDDAADHFKNQRFDVPYLGKITGHVVRMDVEYLVGIRNTKLKQRLVKKLTMKGASFFKFIHPLAKLGHSFDSGDGCIIGPNCTIGDNVLLGNHVVLLSNVRIGDEVTIHDFNFISDYVKIESYGTKEVGSITLQDHYQLQHEGKQDPIKGDDIYY
ncbi:MAG: hypothetical protein KGZ81_06380 [Flavobacteriales bacterium]|nr:hypothetical protein [Flavobacteriales bacterium]